MERTINQEVLNNVDVNYLLRRYKPYELASVFRVSEDYVYKTARLQKELELSSEQAEQEMNYGKNGEWSELKNTELYKKLKP